MSREYRESIYEARTGILESMKVINRLKVLKAFGSLVNDPRKTDRVFEIADLGQANRGPLVEQTLEYVGGQQGLRELYDQGFNVRVPPLLELETYPDGTLGREFARHMLKNGLEVDFFPIPKGQGLERFMIERGRKSHDFWHVMTGFDTSVEGEMGLQGFTLAQLRTPFSALLISVGFLHAILKAPKIYGSMVDNVFAGYQMGLKAKALIGVPFEALLNENLDELRLRLQIVPLSFVNGRN